MRLVQAVADHTMMVPGYEHQTLECPACHEVERRLVFARPVEPRPVEPKPVEPKSLDTKPIELRRPSEEGPASGTAPKGDACAQPPSTWERALDRLRSQQSSLQERAAVAKTPETKHQLHQIWDGFTSRHRTVPPAKPPKTAPAPDQLGAATVVSGQDGTAHAATPTGALARVAAKLRSHQATLQAREAVKKHSLEGQPLEQLWENIGPSARPPTPSGKPPTSQPTPRPRSRSLVPCDTRPAQAPSSWARAVAMLQRRQESAQ
jgi:hypothetical protein